MRFDVQDVELDGARLVCTRCVGSASDSEYIGWLDGYDKMLTAADELGIRIVSIVDTSKSTPPSAHQRRIQSDWNQRTRSLVSHRQSASSVRRPRIRDGYDL